MPKDTVLRFVLTYINKDGMRTLMQAAQGRYTYATEAEAVAALLAIEQNNNARTLASVWGHNPRFEVRPCECWPIHHDPKGVWFDD